MLGHELQDCAVVNEYLIVDYPKGIPERIKHERADEAVNEKKQGAEIHGDEHANGQSPVAGGRIKKPRRQRDDNREQGGALEPMLGLTQLL